MYPCLWKALLVASLFSSWIAIAATQNLTIPSGWLNTTSDLPRGSREILAYNAAISLLSHVDPTTVTNTTIGSSPGLVNNQHSTSTFAVLALQDYYSGNTSWSSEVTEGLQKRYVEGSIYGGDSDMETNSDPIYWALALFYTYRTYKQQASLDAAKAVYNEMYDTAFISTSEADSGTGAQRNISFKPAPGCSLKTFAGGVFLYQALPNRLDVSAKTLAPFMALSAYLFEQTGDSLYQQAAQLSLDFAMNNMWDGTAFTDTIYLDVCRNNGELFTINQWFIEGISVWANVTKNATLTSFLGTVVSSVTTFSTWTLENGVINEAGQSYDTDAVFKGIFVRALTEALMRDPGTALAKYIEAYIYVQYNSILLNSRAPNSDFYTTSWSGPANLSFTAAGNIAALDVLNAAFGIAAIADTPSGGTSSTNDTTGSTSKRLDVGAIAGGVAGGVVAVSATLATLFLRRRRARAREVHSIDGSLYSSDSMDAMDTVQPFVDPPAASTSRSSKRQHCRKSRMGATRSSTMAPLALPADQSVGPEGIITSTSDLGQVGVPGSADFSELPALVRRLYNLMQGRQDEPPPRYES